MPDPFPVSRSLKNLMETLADKFLIEYVMVYYIRYCLSELDCYVKALLSKKLPIKDQEERDAFLDRYKVI